MLTVKKLLTLLTKPEPTLQKEEVNFPIKRMHSKQQLLPNFLTEMIIVRMVLALLLPDSMRSSIPNPQRHQMRLKMSFTRADMPKDPLQVISLVLYQKQLLRIIAGRRIHTSPRLRQDQ